MVFPVWPQGQEWVFFFGPLDLHKKLLVGTPNMSGLSKFLEDLPSSNCPPAEAVDKAFFAWRFVPTADQASLVLDHFLSLAALGVKRPKADPCKMAACSLFVSRECKGFSKAKLLPNFRNKHYAEISVPEGAGQSLENNQGHVSFWMYKSFSPMDHIQQVIENDAA